MERRVHHASEVEDDQRPTREEGEAATKCADKAGTLARWYLLFEGPVRSMSWLISRDEQAA